MRANDNHRTEHIVVIEDGADLGRDVVVRETFEPAVHVLVAPGEELTPEERQQFELFLRWSRTQLNRKLAA